MLFAYLKSSMPLAFFDAKGLNSKTPTHGDILSYSLETPIMQEASATVSWIPVISPSLGDHSAQLDISGFDHMRFSALLAKSIQNDSLDSGSQSSWVYVVPHLYSAEVLGSLNSNCLEQLCIQAKLFAQGSNEHATLSLLDMCVSGQSTGIFFLPVVTQHSANTKDNEISLNAQSNKALHAWLAKSNISAIAAELDDALFNSEHSLKEKVSVFLDDITFQEDISINMLNAVTYSSCGSLDSDKTSIAFYEQGAESKPLGIWNQQKEAASFATYKTLAILSELGVKLENVSIYQSLP